MANRKSESALYNKKPPGRFSTTQNAVEVVSLCFSSRSTVLEDVAALGGTQSSTRSRTLHCGIVRTNSRSTTQTM